MIPTLLLAGLVVGLLVRGRAGRARGAAVTLVVALGWGTAIGVADRSLSTAVAASALGLANLAVGLAVGATARKGGVLVAARTRADRTA